MPVGLAARMRSAHRPSLTAGRWAAALALLYGLTVVVFAFVPAASPVPAALASSPQGVLRGEWWGLLTSGLVVAGDPAFEVPATVLAVILLIRWGGVATFWRAAIAGHVGATLLAYGGLALVWVFARSDLDLGVLDAPDYGISCVWAASVGALLGLHRRRSRPGRWLGTLSAVGGFFLWVELKPDLVGVEHLLAFAVGIAVGVRALAGRVESSRKRRGSDRRLGVTPGLKPEPPHLAIFGSGPQRASGRAYLGLQRGEQPRGQQDEHEGKAMERGEER